MTTDPAPLRIYTKPFCSHCWRAKRLLRRRGIAFEEIGVGQDRALRSWLATASGQSTVPQVFVGERSLGGYTELAQLERSGELARLLGR